MEKEIEEQPDRAEAVSDVVELTDEPESGDELSPEEDPPNADDAATEVVELADEPESGDESSPEEGPADADEAAADAVELAEEPESGGEIVQDEDPPDTDEAAADAVELADEPETNDGSSPEEVQPGPDDTPAAVIQAADESGDTIPRRDDDKVDVQSDSGTVDQSENDFASLDDDEFDGAIDSEPAQQKSPVDDKANKETSSAIQAETGKKKDTQPADPSPGGRNENASNTPNPKQNLKKKLSAAMVVITFTGIVIFAISSLMSRRESVPVVPEPVVTLAPEARRPDREVQQPAQAQRLKPAVPAKYDKYLTKVKEADRLRNDLLEKKEEIFRLKWHYRSGIDELMNKISRQIEKTNISSLDEAIRHKSIELDLRTIQRRLAYIQELEKPDQWVHKGSEELLYLKRKTLLDLQLADIASGIDLERHWRYINAAIQKYQPSAENLAVDNRNTTVTDLDSIWARILERQAHKVEIQVSAKDEEIIAELCSGNSSRIAELGTLTADAARCLSQTKGSDLFLNGVNQLAPEQAESLSRWQGNWICLNGIKSLSPAVAKHLFKWRGNWISLNGLTEFTPELAIYLMEWEGSQLELMGLTYDKVKPDQRTLKYLALWETLGGKLFVSDGIRKAMERVL